MRINIIEAPNHEVSDAPSLFLAGGITNCENWQKTLIDLILKEEYNMNLNIFNPRRENFPIDIPEETERQIVWEFGKLSKFDIICFWFSNGSLNPIVLYELGYHGNSRDTKIVIGLDPGYQRKEDIKIQTKLARPDIEIFEDFQSFSSEVIKELKTYRKHEAYWF